MYIYIYIYIIQGYLKTEYITNIIIFFQIQVLVALKMTPNDLATHQEKIYDIDDHMGLVFSGLTADARFLTKFMRNESLNYWYAYDS